MSGVISRHVYETLSRLPSCRNYWLAYSGGRDSHVLLHVLAAIRQELWPAQIKVVHIDHGLHPDAGQWAAHCQSVCDALDLPLLIRQVNARPAAGESPEAAARKARYAELAELIGAGDILLAAHHQDDQAETLMLQLLRGAGPHGLAAMHRYLHHDRRCTHCRCLSLKNVYTKLSTWSRVVHKGAGIGTTLCR